MKTKLKNNNALWIVLLLIVAGAVIYFKTNLFSAENKKIVIPEGAYVLEKSPEKGVLKILEEVSSNLHGLGDHLTVYGDSIVQSTGTISTILASVDGGMTKFKLQKTATENQFLLYLNNSSTVPLELTNSKELRISIGSSSLIYQKQ